MTVEELLAREAIKEVRIAYSHYFDGQDIDALVGLFTDDAICEFGEAFGGDWIGKDTIRANYSKFLGGGDTPEYSVLHSVTNPLIKLIDADTAHGRWYLHDLRTTVGVEDPIILYGIYDDVYRRVGDRWLISKTRIDFLWPRREVNPPREF